MRLRLSYGRLVLGLGVLAAITYAANEGQQRWSGNKGSALLGQVVENVTVCSPDGKACYCNESFAGVTVACCAQNQQQLIQALENAVNGGDESTITTAQSALDQFNADFEAAQTDNDSLEAFVTNRCAQIECTECNIAIDWVIQYQPPSSASSATTQPEGASTSSAVSSQSSSASFSKSSGASVPASSVSSGAAQNSSVQSAGIGPSNSAGSVASIGIASGSSTSRSSASSTSRSSVSSISVSSLSSGASVSSIQLSSGASSVTSSKSSGASVASSVSSAETLTFGETGKAGFCCLQGRTKAISCASVPPGSSGNVSNDVCIDIGDPANPADDIKGVVHETEATCKQQCQWCGDGIIQAARGEQCDNGEPNSRAANAQNIGLLPGVTPGKKREVGAVNIPVEFANDTITQEEIDKGINAPWIDSWVPQMEKSSCTTACTIGACGRLQNDRPYSKQLQKCLNAFAVNGVVKCQPFVTQMVDLDGIGKLEKEEYGVLDPDSTASRQYPMVDLLAPGCSILRSRNTVGRFEFQQYGVPLDPEHRQLQEQEDQLSFFQWIRSLMGSLLAAITTQEGAPCSLYSVPGREPKCGNGLRCVVAVPGGKPTCQPPIPPNSNVAPQKPKPSPPTNYNPNQNNTTTNNTTTSNYPPPGTRWNPTWGNNTGGNYGGSYGWENYSGGGYGSGGGGGGSTWAVPAGAPVPVVNKCSCGPTDTTKTVQPDGWKEMSREDRISACTANGGSMVICQDSYCGGDAPKWPVGHCQDGQCPDPVTIPNWCLFLNACTPEKLRQIDVQCDEVGNPIPNPVEQAQTDACYKNNLLVDGGFEDIACDSSGEAVGATVLNDYVIYVPLPANPSKADSNYSVYPKLADPFDQFVEVQSGGSWTRLFGGAAAENGTYDSLSDIALTEQTAFRIVVPLNYAGIAQHFPHVANTPLATDKFISIASNDSDHVRIIKNGDIHPILSTHSYDSFTIESVARYKELVLTKGSQSTTWIIGAKIAPYFDSQGKAVLEPNQFLIMADFEGPEASSSHGDEYIRHLVIASDMTLVESEKNTDDPFLMRRFDDLVLLVTKGGGGGGSLPICTGPEAFMWPKSVGVWGGDPAEAVRTNQGIDPAKGQQMLRFLATSRVDTDINELVDEWQLIDAVEKGIKPGDILNLQALFNRVELDEETDTAFTIDIRFYARTPEEFFNEGTYDDYLDGGGFVLDTDDDLETWERASLLHPVPNSTQTIAVHIAPSENIVNDGAGETEFDGHYADEVCLHVVPECSDGYDNDGDGNYDLDDSGCSSASDDSEYVPSSCRDWNLLTNSAFNAPVTVTGNRPSVPDVWDGDPGHVVGPIHGIVPLSDGDAASCSVSPTAPPPATTAPPPGQNQQTMNAGTSLYFIPLPDNPAKPNSFYAIYPVTNPQVYTTILEAETSPGTWEPFFDATNTQQAISTANATKAASRQIAVRGRTPVNYNILLNSFPHLAQTSLKTKPEVVIQSSQPEHIRVIRNGDLYPVLNMVNADSYVYLPDQNSTTTKKDPRGITFRRAQALTDHGHIVMSPPQGSFIGAASFAYVYVPPALKPYFDSNGRAKLGADESLIMVEYQTVKKNSWADEPGIPEAMKQGFTVISSAEANGDRLVEAVNKHPDTYLMNPQPNLDYLDRVYRISSGNVSMIHNKWYAVPTSQISASILGASTVSVAGTLGSMCKHETSLIDLGLEKVTIQEKGNPDIYEYIYTGDDTLVPSGDGSERHEVFFPDASDHTDPGSIRTHFSIRFIRDATIKKNDVDILMHFKSGEVVDADPMNSLSGSQISGRVVIGGFPFCGPTAASPENSCGIGMWQFDASHIGVMGNQNAPACSDGIDNDADGSIDMDDSGCDSPNDTSEYTPGLCQASNLLVDGGFEQLPALDAYPTTPGFWGGGDDGKNVGTTLGITPLSGSKMHQALTTGGKTAINVQSDHWQFIDAKNIPAGSIITAEGFFNRVEGDNETDTGQKVTVYTYPFPIGEFTSRHSEFTAMAMARMETDGDVRTWQKATRSLVVPPGTQFLGVNVTPVENVMNDPAPPEFDGHFSDEVCVFVQPHGYYGYACSDGVDNDGDGKVDALIESTINQSVTKTLWSKQETSIRDFVNEKGAQLGYTQIPTIGSVGMVNYDRESAKKVCQLAGYADVVSYECESAYDDGRCGYSSCGDNKLAHWDSAAGDFVIKSACDMGNQWLAGLTCGGVFAACSDGIDNDRDGKTDFPADDGCNSADDIDEREHDPECADLKGATESAVTICTIEDLESEERASSSETPGCHLASDVWQIVEIPAGTKPESFAHGEAFFNHLHMDEETDTHFRVTVRTYDFPPSQFNTRFLESTREFFQDIESDGVAATWQYANVGFQIPEGTTFMAMKLTAGEDVMNDLNFPEYDAHFADEVCLEIISPAQCEDNYDNDGDGFTDFPDDPGCDSSDDDDETDTAGSASSGSSKSGSASSTSGGSQSSAIACTPGTTCPTGEVCPVNGVCPAGGSSSSAGSATSAGVCDGKRCGDNGNAGNLFCQSQNMSCLDSNSPPCLRCVVPTSAGFGSSRSSSRSSVISCTPGAQCDNGTSCPINGVCSDTCTPGNVCPNGLACPVNGLCPQTCSPGDRCPNGLSCPVNGVCPPLNQCDEDTDCGTGELCTNGYCSLPICGNGFVDVGEACDDGYVFGESTCSDECRLTEGPCTSPGQCQSLVCRDGACNACQSDIECPAGFRCAEGGCIPQALKCGDGVLDPGEYCDDGNRADNDACSSDCLLSNNQACALNEQCDSGLCLDGKCSACGDDSQCSEGQICAAGKCINPDSLHRPMFCGNGRMDAGEECDLGQFNSNAPSALCTYDCRLPNGHRAEGGPDALPGSVVDLPFTPAGSNGDGIGGNNGSGVAGNVTNHAPVGDTGPAAVAVMAAGAAAGFAYMRRRMRP